MLENPEFDVDDPIDDLHGPVRLPFLRKGTKKKNTNIYQKII